MNKAGTQAPDRPEPEARRTIRALSASPIRAVANAAMGREGVLPFWFGEADQPTADFIRQAAVDSLARGETCYSENLGRPYLRTALSAYLTRLHDRPISVDRLAICGSGVQALMLAAQLLLDPGDSVVAITPIWPNLVEIPAILSASVTRVPLRVRDNRWHLDMDALLQTLEAEDARVLLVNSPNNPTGWTITDAEIEILLPFCRARGIWILCDDVYQRLLYDPDRAVAPSFLSHQQADDRILSTNSFSKAWSMTGWRAGWLVTPPGMTADLGKIIEYNTSCVFEPVQRAAQAALVEGEPEVARLRARLRETRAVLTQALAELPEVEAPAAAGAMYLFFRLRGHNDSEVLARRLIDEVGLGLAPGSAFGPESQAWLRWCHATSPERLLDGVARLKRFLARSGR